MQHIKNLFFIVMGILLITSCKKQILEKQVNPNNPTSVPPGLILGTVLTNMSGTGSQGDLGGINSWGSVQAWNQYHDQNYDYYGNNIYSWDANNSSFDPYLVLKNVDQMEKEATARGSATVNPYEAVGRFVRAYYFYNLTSMFGDIPLVGTLEGSVNPKPAYTPQEQVFSYVLNQLDSANTDFAALMGKNDNSLSSTQDIYYHGNLSSWQKLANSFKLRVLISLSKQSSDAILNIPAQFASIIKNPAKYPIFNSQSDDFEFVYNPGGANTFSTYPFNPSNFGSIAGRFNMAATYVSALTSLMDPRVFVTSEPASALLGNDSNPAQFKYFVGASTGEPVQSMYGNASAGKYSFINRKRYYSNFTGEPNVLVGYKEMLFNIAEGIERGWASGTAETFYKNGITESMSFYGIDVSKLAFTAYFMPPGANSVTQVTGYPVSFDFSSYYNQPAVKLSATANTAITQIVLQKYIAMFENSGFEPYYNWRRTGVPPFQTGSGVGNNGVIPLRWAYPISEQTQNTASWKAALTVQGFAADNLNQVMWLIK